MGARFLRRMDWLGAARALGYLRLLALLNAAMLIVLVATSHRGIDRNGFLLGSDFISFWTVGRMLHAGGAVYDTAAHIAAQRTYYAPPGGYTAFFYPPSFLPLCWPLGLLGYFPALAAWLLATGACYVASVRAWWREAGRPAPAWLLLAAFPAVPIVVTHGQTAFLVAALLGGGVLLVRSRPMLAGVLFGLATIKPQFGVLLPLVLLLTGQWRTILGAAVSALVLCALGAVLSGAEAWPQWLAASTRAQEAMTQGAVNHAKMISPFAALKLLGAATTVAYAVQGAVSLAVAAMLGRAAWRRGWSQALGAAVLAGAPLATPFALDYDMAVLAFPLLWLTGQGLRTGFADWEKLAVLLAFAAPAFARPLALATGVPIAPPILMLLFAVTLRRSLRG
ncbi:glycosyltransferase family 87 protein [Novosphingobium resinovorum]|uniref:glycosyltransferase family 87 protein n=1 Tax=Novosphingobium resinovorum TaxID=158500 RepID=UPI002ED3BE03|nr:glycosyltransferase family 87 protein [Novosphingobium resinovorum]